MTQPTQLHGDSPDHKGSGHGGWIVTYCDMVTILLACFICIVTFASREHSKHSRRRGTHLDSGTGVLSTELKGVDRNALILQGPLPSGQPSEGGSEVPPLYSDPSLEPPAELLRVLEDPTLGTLANSYTLRVPLNMLLQADGQLSATGSRLLHTIAKNIRPLPYDLHILVDAPQHLSSAILLSRHVAQQESIHPGRLGVGERQRDGPGGAFLWFVFFRNS